MKTIEVLIVTRSVFLQQGLGALLESLPQISRVKATRDLQSAFTLIAEHQPKIVLLDETLLGKDPKPALEKIRSLAPDTKRALLVDDVLEMDLLVSHAEAVLIKGTAPASIASIITSLLSEKGDKHEHDDSR
jgi:DNA-binding NarL/FixJ family response regulator